jgi:hypothetical protein
MVVGWRVDEMFLTGQALRLLGFTKRWEGLARLRGHWKGLY